MRLQMSKKERSEQKRQSRQTALDELLQFGDYMALTNAEKRTEKRGGEKRKHSKRAHKGLKGSKRSRKVCLLSKICIRPSFEILV